MSDRSPTDGQIRRAYEQLEEELLHDYCFHMLKARRVHERLGDGHGARSHHLIAEHNRRALESLAATLEELGLMALARRLLEGDAGDRGAE
jgi:hypothetical protein